MAVDASEVQQTATNGVSSLAIAHPVRLAANAAGDGDMLVLLVGYANSSEAAPTLADGSWTSLGAAVYGGAGAFGSDPGPRGLAGWWKVSDGTETDGTGASVATVTVTNGGTGSTRIMRAVMTRVAKSAATWATPTWATATDASADTSLSLSTGSNPGGAAGDFVVAAGAWSPSSATPSGGASSVIVWPGAGVSTTQGITGTVSVTNTMRLNTYTAPVTSTPTGNASLSLTLASAGAGVGAFVRLRATGVPPVAYAGESKSVEPGSTCVLDGSESQGTIASWQWTQTGGPAVALSSRVGLAPSLTPPTGWESFTPLDVSAGGTIVLDNATDYKVVGQTAATKVLIRGGRRVVVMGLTINVDDVAGWTTSSESSTCGLELQTYPSNGTGAAADAEFYIEGLLVQGNTLTQGIRLNAQSHAVKLVNYHVAGVRFDDCDHRDGTNGRSTNHPDAIQAYNGAFKSLDIDGMTAYSGYQGIFLRIGDSAGYPTDADARPVTMRRTDLHAIEFTGSDGYDYAGHRMLWNYGHLGTTLFPITLDEDTYTDTYPSGSSGVWVKGHIHNGWQPGGFYRVRYWDGSAYVLDPVPSGGLDVHAVAQGAASAPDATGTDAVSDWASFSSGISGKIRLGSPPDGEHVPAALTGATYDRAAFQTEGTSAQPTFTAPAVVGGTTLTFTLQVTDSGGQVSNVDTVTVTALPPTELGTKDGALCGVLVYGE